MIPLLTSDGRRRTARKGGARTLLVPSAASALLLVGCEQRICPDPELAQGTWIPSGGTADWAPQAYVAATETELYIYQDNVILIFDPLTHEGNSGDSGAPTQVLSPGFAATSEGALLVSGAVAMDSSRRFYPVAQLWDRATDTWQELELPDYTPPGAEYQMHWTGEVFIMLGATDGTNQWLGGGAVLDPVTLEWQPLFDGIDVPETLVQSIWTNHGLFLWAARQPSGPGEAWLFTVEEGWTAFSMEGAPTDTYYHYLSTDGELIWLSGGYRGSTPVDESWEVNLAQETWGPRKPPPGAPPDLRVGGAMPVGDWFLVSAPGCDEGAFWIHRPDTGEWGVGRPSPARGWGPGWMGVIAGHVVTYGEVGDGWATGQMYTYYPECEPGTSCDVQ